MGRDPGKMTRMMTTLALHYAKNGKATAGLAKSGLDFVKESILREVAFGYYCRA
jgi:hypothetical protein